MSTCLRARRAWIRASACSSRSSSVTTGCSICCTSPSNLCVCVCVCVCVLYTYIHTYIQVCVWVYVDVCKSAVRLLQTWRESQAQRRGGWAGGCRPACAAAAAADLCCSQWPCCHSGACPACPACQGWRLARESRQCLRLVAGGRTPACRLR